MKHQNIHGSLLFIVGLSAYIHIVKINAAIMEGTANVL